MQTPRRPLIPARWLPIVILLFSAGVVWWSMRDVPPGGPARKADAWSVSAKAPGPAGATRESKADRKSESVSAGATARRGPPDSAIERGPNNVLIHHHPRDVGRRVVAGKIFAEEVLRVRDGRPRGPLTPSAHSLSAVEAAYDPGVVQRFIESDAEALRLPLDAQRTVVVHVERLLSRGPVTHTLLGKVDRDAFSEVLLVFHDGAVSGSVAFYDVNAHYEFGLAGNGDIAIRRLDPDSFSAPCGNPGDPGRAEAVGDERDAHREDFEPPGVPEVPGAPPADPPPEEPEAATVVMDTVVGYGNQARIAEGGVAAMEARIIAAVDRMNAAFANSEVVEVEVVLLGTVEDPDYTFPGAVAGEMGSSDELGDLKSTTDGTLDTVSDLRIQLGADHNAFIIKETDGPAGIASRPGRAMVVARTYMSSTRLTFAHEFGHNIGCQHAWADTSSGTGTSSHNYGWRFDPPGSGKFRTIMSYDWGWTRIPYFSNPSVQYNGVNTGAVNGYNASGDGTTDSRLVSGGYIGTAGSGYDGTHALLGARNADYIMANAGAVADNAARPAPEIVVEQPAGSGLIDEVSTVDFNAPSVGAVLDRTFVIRNTGKADLTGLRVTMDGSHAADFTIGSLGATTVAPGSSTSFSVTYLPPAVGVRTATLHIASDDEDESPFDVALTGAVRTVITEEGFEVGLGEWTHSTGSDFNWLRDSGGTPSSNTGPDDASEGTWYVYTEASSPNYPGKTAGLEQEFDFSGFADLVMTFEFHMFGRAMGTLSVDVFDGAWNLGVWSRSGAQQTSGSGSWTRASVDLSAYHNASGVKIRFRGETGDDYQGDMAIDAVTILGAPSGNSSGTTYADWAIAFGLTGADALPVAVPYRDGIANLLKYGCNMDGGGPDTRSLVPATGTSGLPVLLVDDSGPAPVLRFEYLRRMSGGITYTPVQSPSAAPGSWAPMTGAVTVTNIDGTWERIVIEHPFDAGFPPEYFRVELSLP